VVRNETAEAAGIGEAQVMRGGRQRPWLRGIHPFTVLGAAVIIAAVSGLVYPIFSRTDGGARRTVCASNLKQIGLAFRMYLNDYDGYWPLRDSWCDALMPYMKNRGILHCPAVTGRHGGYAYNSELAGVSEKRIVAAHLIVTAFDAKPGWNISGGAELAVNRHPEGINTLFADGHSGHVVDVRVLHWDPSYQPPTAGRTPSRSGK
jgi:prepilin-type processing-associated H-X9-DG protein